MALPHRIVVEVVRGSHLDYAGAELPINVVVGDDGNLAAGQRQLHLLADQMSVALILGMDHHRGIAK